MPAREISLLLIDSNEQHQDVVQDLLGDRYDLYLAHNGRDGIKQAHKHIPDIIFINKDLPEGNSAEICQQLKSHQLSSHIPILLIGRQINPFRAKIKYKVDVFLEYPYSMRQLLVQVRKMIQFKIRLQERYALFAKKDTRLVSEESLLSDLILRLP